VQIETLGRIGGHEVRQVTLEGRLRLVLLTHGARLAQLWAPDRDGRLADVVLGHDDLADYAANHGFLGATCGRFANRIAGARFPLDGTGVRLVPNEGTTQLHGGPQGFDAAPWTITGASATEVTFAHESPAGDMGFPGRLNVRCTYRLDGLCLWIGMTATTDAPTVVNLAHHSYFNLGGQGAGDVLGHRLKVAAEHYLPVDAAKVPTGAVLPVAGTAFDFTALRPIGQALPGPGGFDHCYCLSQPLQGPGGALLRPAARLVDPASGRSLRLATNQPGLQVYTGAHFDATPGKSGARYPRFAGVALETQGFPDAPNRPQFPSARLDPGQTYRHLMRLNLTPDPAGSAPAGFDPA
jgi:aldose 1-epimerase